MTRAAMHGAPIGSLLLGFDAPVADRWAIVAYVRTLQLSQYAPAADVPADRHGELEASLQALDTRDDDAGEQH